MGQLWRSGSEAKIGEEHDWLPLILLLLGLAAYFAYLLTAPPGVHGDSARLGLHALDFLQRGIWPFYIYHQAAPNALLVYLQSLAFVVLGFTPAALRGVTAFLGALAVPAVYLASRELFAGDGERFARQAGFVAAVGLALCPYFGTYSRYGIEPSVLPAVEVLAVASLWRGLRRRRWQDFFLSGILVGVSQYTYIVGRVFPLALAIACGIAFLTDRQLLARWRGVALAACSAVLVALPQWVLFLQAPYTLVARTQGANQPFVFGLPGWGTIFATKLVNQFLMLGWRWSTGYHPGSNRPLLTPVLFVGLLLALGLTFWKRRAGWIFNLSLAALMLAPDLFFYEGLSPSANRTMGALPFLFVMAGLGCAALWRWLEARSSLPAWVGLLVPLAVLLAGGESQWHFATRVLPKVYATPGLEWKVSLVEIAEADYIAAHLDEAMLLPSSEYQRAPLAFLLAEYFPRRASGLPLPLSPMQTITVIAPAEPERAGTEGIPAGYRPDEWVLLENGVAYFLPPVSDAVEPVGDSELIYASNGAAAANVFSAHWRGVLSAYEPVDASFVNGLDLVGYQTGEFLPGQPLTVTLYWRPRHEVRSDVQMFVQLLDLNGHRVTGVHDWPLREAYRVRAWHPGETMPLSYRLDIPLDLAPGPYRLIVGPYDLIHQRRVPLNDGQEYATVGVLKVPLEQSTAAPDQVVEADFGGVIGLTGYSLSTSSSGLDVLLYWVAQASPQVDYTVFIHLIDAGGQIAAQIDAQPLAGQYPTSVWSLGEQVVDRQRVAVAPGEYEVYVGLYRWETMERLTASLGGERLPDDRLLLGTVTVP
jgi:4-amino-4-deoxy-L-arabinose transferase-like glycosyltransferase